MPENRMKEWLTWKVFLPFVLLILMWPVYWMIEENFTVGEAFRHAFSHCELLIFSSLVFLEIAIELNYLQEKDAPQGVGWSDIARMVAFLPIFFYGFIVSQVTRLARTPTPQAEHRVTMYSGFAFSFALLAVVTSVYAFWKVKHIELARRAQRAREPKRRHA